MNQRDHEELVEIVGAAPLPIALVLHEYIVETGDYVRLHRMCAAVEITCRFFVAVSLADLRRVSGNNPFPQRLKSELTQHLERPTLASWRVLLHSAMTELQGAGAVSLPKLPEFAARLVCDIGSGRDDPLERLLPMRNELAHSGRLSEHRVRQLLEAHQERFDSLFSELSFVKSAQLVALESPHQGLALSGLSRDRSWAPAEGDRPVVDSALEFPRLCFVTPHAMLDLSPMDSYGEVFHAVDERLERVGEKAVQLYCRRVESGGIELTSFGPRFSVSRASDELDREFSELFPVDIWRSAKRFQGELADFDFGDRVRALTRLFVGRLAELESAAARIDAMDKGILWMGGKPGMGKSAFLAKLIDDHYLERADVIVVPYFFVASEISRCRMDAFVRAVLLHLLSATGSSQRLASDPEQRLQQVRSLVNEVVIRRKQKIIFFLDAIDEVAAVDPSWSDLIFDESLQRVVWVCTSRDEPEITSEFTVDRCHWLFKGDGLLPPLSSNDIRGFIVEELGHRLPELFSRDESHAQQLGRNAFVDVVLDRSGGLPLYLKLLVDQLRAGKLDFSPASEVALPDGLKDYYNTLLEHPDMKSILWAVLALLSQAKEALSLKTIREMLQEHYLLNQPRGDQRLLDALRLGHVMLKRATDQDGHTAYELYHYSFRQHLNETEQFAAHIVAARDWITKYCWTEYQQRPHAMSSYSLAHLPAHLYDSRRLMDLHRVLTDSRLGYIERWIHDGEHRDGTRLVTAVVEHLDEQGDKQVEVAGLATALSRMWTRQARYDLARVWVERSLANTSWFRGRRTRAVALHEYGSLYLYAGDFNSAKRYYRAALRLSKWGIPRFGVSGQYLDQIGANLVGLATVAIEERRLKRVVRLARKARRVSRRAHDLRHQVAAESLIAAGLRTLARLDRARAQFDETEETCRRHSLHRELGHLLLLRGWMEYAIATIESEEPRLAKKTFEEAMEASQRAGAIFAVLEVSQAIASCAIACGQLDQAERLLQDVAQQLPPERRKSLQLGNLFGFACIEHCRGNLKSALGRYEVVFLRSQECNDTLFASQAKTGAGACHWHLGDESDAAQAWAEAVKLADLTSPLHLMLVNASIETCKKNPTNAPR